MSESEQRTVDRRRMLQLVGTGSMAAFAGCAGGDDTSESEPAGQTASESEPEAVTVEDDATWRTATLTDVTTGDEFRITDFDRPVIVHTFARGCAACHSQQREFDALYANGGTDVEIVDLTIDPNDNPEDIQTYADEDGFDWRFGNSPEKVTGSLVEYFGQEVTVSAASPVIIVCPDGGTYRLDKVVDASDLESALGTVC